ncbi:hypothetical protein [Algibacter aquimarinus]|uniref:Uncharacterized protein n=1 Tax=Algibacter aquimarinus TaxID=1136748 RepID=A0ABP9H0V9_9FLAO
MNLYVKQTLVLLFLSVSSFSQEYTIETINLWEDNNIPFNKENIVLNETLDEVGTRYTQISEPAIFVYKNKVVKKTAQLYCFVQEEVTLK